MQSVCLYMFDYVSLVYLSVCQQVCLYWGSDRYFGQIVCLCVCQNVCHSLGVSVFQGLCLNSLSLNLSVT